MCSLVMFEPLCGWNMVRKIVTSKNELSGLYIMLVDFHQGGGEGVEYAPVHRLRLRCASVSCSGKEDKKENI